MTDYSKGQIYKIVDNGYNKCYIGSTVQKLYDRMAKHRCHYKEYIKGLRKFDNTVYYIFDEYGVENCKIEWIEDYPCNSKKELEAREGKHQKENDCVNKIMVGRTHKEHYADNRDKINQQVMENYYKNKDRISEQRKQRRRENPEQVRELERQAYQRNKEQKLQKAKEKVLCICGSICCRSKLRRHETTEKHQQYIQSLEQSNPQE